MNILVSGKSNILCFITFRCYPFVYSWTHFVTWLSVPYLRHSW